MNRHRYGEPVGLPLNVLNATSVSQGHWRQSWSARVIDDELFVSATHTIDSYGLGDQGLRFAIDRRDRYSICPHVDPSKEIAALKRPRNTRKLFSECQDFHRSYLECYTDYSTTIERKGTTKGSSESWNVRRTVNTGWVITLVVYYQFENCRFPYEIFGLPAPIWWNFRSGFKEPRDQRPGSVRDIWMRDVAETTDLSILG